MKCLFISLLCSVLCGCAVFGPAVPNTTMTLSVNGKKASWSCPKQFTATNLTFIVQTNGSCELRVGSVSSVNSPSVISDSFTGQALLIKQWGDTGASLMQAGASVAEKAAVFAMTNNPPKK